MLDVGKTSEVQKWEDPGCAAVVVAGLATVALALGIWVLAWLS